MVAKWCFLQATLIYQWFSWFPIYGRHQSLALVVMFWVNKFKPYIYLLNKLFALKMSQLFSLFNSLSWLLYTKPEARISVLHYIAGIFPQLVPVHICAYMYNLLCYSLFGRRDVRSRGCLLEMPPATPRSWLLALNVFWCLSPAERLMIPLLQDSSSSQIGMV